MLLNEYQVRDELETAKECAQALRKKFEAGADPEDLMIDAENLERLCERLKQILPDSVAMTGNLGRHIWFMKKRLGEGRPDQCVGDINDICSHDLPAWEHAFRQWCAQPDFFDDELAEAVSTLLLHQELDSAVRKAFVLLTQRICKVYGVPAHTDGMVLVNKVFGSSATAKADFMGNERLAWRNLLAGLYGVFRNKYAHTDATPSWAEAEAVLSMVNYVLKELPCGPDAPSEGNGRAL